MIVNMNSDDEEDISPNPDTSIEYGADMAGDKGDINCSSAVHSFTRDIFQETLTSSVLNKVMQIIYNIPWF